MTKSALHFWERAKVYDASSWAAYLSVEDRVKLYTDEDEWSAWDAVGDPVVHIQVRTRGLQVLLYACPQLTQLTLLPVSIAVLESFENGQIC